MPGELTSEVISQPDPAYANLVPPQAHRACGAVFERRATVEGGAGAEKPARPWKSVSKNALG